MVTMIFYWYVQNTRGVQKREYFILPKWSGKASWKRGCYGLNYVPPKFVCSRPNPQYLRMWPYLEIDLYRGNRVKWKLLEWALIQYDHCPYKKRKFRHRHRHRGRSCEGTGRTWSSTSPGERPGPDPSLTALRRNQLLTPWFQTSIL